MFFITFDFTHTNVYDLDFRTIADMLAKIVGVGIFLYILLSTLLYPCNRSALNNDLMSQMKQVYSEKRPSEFMKESHSDNYLKVLKDRLSFTGLNNLFSKVNEIQQSIRIIEREIGISDKNNETDKDYQLARLRVELENERETRQKEIETLTAKFQS